MLHKCIQVSEEGFLGSTYTKTSKVLIMVAAAALLLYQLSSWLIFSLGKSIILVIDESPTTLFYVKSGLYVYIYIYIWFVTNSSIKHQSFVDIRLNDLTILSKQFNLEWVICLHSVKTSNCSIWSIDQTLWAATTPSQSGPWYDGKEGVLRIPQKLQHYWSPNIRLFSVISRTLVEGF